MYIPCSLQRRHFVLTSDASQLVWKINYELSHTLAADEALVLRDAEDVEQLQQQPRAVNKRWQQKVLDGWAGKAGSPRRRER